MVGGVSGSLMRLAVMQAQLPRAETCVAFRIIDLGRTDKTTSEIAMECAISSRAARRAFARLCVTGWLHEERRGGRMWRWIDHPRVRIKTTPQRVPKTPVLIIEVRA